MFKVGDKVLFSIANDNKVQLKTEIGIILKVNEDVYSILRVTLNGANIYHNISIDKITHLENRDQVENEIINFYKDLIDERKNRLQIVTDDMKKDEKVAKYEKLKTQIKTTAKNLYTSEDDSDFENKLKAICHLKKQLFTIEIDCVSIIRKNNGSIWYDIKLIEGNRNMLLKNISEETVSKVFEKF